MPRIAPKLFTIGLLVLFTGSLFLNIAPRYGLALDAFEPNNSDDLVTVLHKGNYSDLSLYAGDEDNFCVFLGVGGNMSIVLWNYTQTPTFNVKDPSRQTYASPVTEGFTQTVNILSVKEAGFYYIEISCSSSTDYALNITDIEALVDDPYEPNNNFTSAGELFLDMSYLSLPLWDDDFFKISLGENENVSIRMNRTGGSSDEFEVALFAPDNETLLDYASLDRSSTIELSLVNASTAGTYCLKVSYAFGAWGNYSLTIQRLDDDALEPNDNFTTAATLEINIKQGNLCWRDDDYYNVSLTAGDDICINFSRSEGMGTLMLSLFAPDQSAILATSSVDSASSGYPFALNVPYTDEYTLKIHGTRGTRGNYSLHVILLLDDGREMNNGFADATPLMKNSPFTNVAYLDEDFYNVTLAAGGNLSVQFTRYGTLGDGDLSLSIYAPDKVTILSTVRMATGSGGEVVLLSAPESGQYSIRVNGSATSWGNYTILATDFCDDIYEENDAFETAAPFPKNGPTLNLVLLDDDFFNVTLAQGENLSVGLVRLKGSGMVELFLIAPNQTTILQSATVPVGTPKILFLFGAPSAGSYFVRVHPSEVVTGNYSLYIANPVEDMYEENDALGSGPFLTKGSTYNNLVLIDDDFYQISLQAGDNLSIVLTTSSMNYGTFYMHLFSPSAQLLSSQAIGVSRYNYWSWYRGEIFLPEVTESGTYYVLVNKTANAFGYYTLYLRDLPDDSLEPNDAFGSAASIASGDYYPALSLCDDDYYRIELSPGSNISIIIGRVVGGEFVNVYLYDSDATTLLKMTSTLASYSCAVVLNASTAHTYYLKVNGTCWTYNNYSLLARDAYDDAWEENDDMASASLLVNGSTYTDLIFRDDDFFNVTLLAGGEFAATLYRAGGSGILYFTLFGPDGLQMANASVDSTVAQRPIYITSAPATGLYTLKVNGSEGTVGTYAIALGAIPDDPYEDNDAFDHAPCLGKWMTYDALQLFDTDFYSYDAAAGENFRVTLDVNAIDVNLALNLTIYAPDRITILAAGKCNFFIKQMFNGFSLCVPNAAGGTYYLKVNATPGSYYPYSLNIADFLDDAREDNDDAAHAAPGYPSVPQVIGISADEDWYKLTLTADDTLWMYWAFPDVSAGFSLELRASDGTTVLPLTPFEYTQQSAYNWITCACFSSTTAGDFYLRISSTTGRATQYILFTVVFRVSQPADLTYYEHSLGNTLIWVLNDVYQIYSLRGSAAVYREGTPAPLLEQEWITNADITVNVDGLAPGTYVFTLAVIHWSGASRNDTVTVRVLPDVVSLSSPMDVTFNVGTTGNRLTWMPTAVQVGTTSYEILVDGVVVATGTWTNQTAISYTLDSLAPGTHVVTLIVWNGLGTTQQDEVSVTVVGGFPMEFVFIAVAAGVGIALVAVYFVRRRKRRALNPV